jgi:hypothetical protein
MSWNEKMKEWGGGDFGFLSEDGESITFMVCGDPILLQSKYKNQVQERIGVPCMTDEGFRLLVIGKRLARKISKHEGLFNDVALVATRHGSQNDPATSYDLVVDPTPELVARLRAMKESDYSEDALQQALVDVKQVLEA